MLDRLNEALEHIESCLDESQLDRHGDRQIDVAVLARIAMTSEYHFRRMFSALAGMPLSEYIRRRRLTVAGAEVLAGERTLLEIAVRYGYGSGEAFARAFRAVHGVGPGEARRGGASLRSQQRISFRLVVEGRSSMRYRVVEKAEFRVAGKKVRAPLVHEGVNPALADFIRSIDQETIGRISALSDQEPAGIVAVSDDLDPSRAEGTEFDYYHGVVTGSASVPEDFDALTVPAGAWAVFESSGPFPQALQHLWRDVFTQWFPSNPYRSRPGPEILRVRVSQETADAEAQADAELWIPVARATA
ncbi:helix-turn-helix domain-containing protein [Streptomyces sp. NRRL B-1677]|uniref:Helix-turn-helix domain-containing protein n=1 Tax=Streptomyces klenkii TaxID=1420899 RepID=A0A3B0BE37_9ACTN|nr:MULTISPECIES: GyrI-like domain-containing protein [Streptomyces]MBF6044282.1 helix-turn-helix domain-containing protein [Streptomyces sp. NRRL B-1677]RKN70296.1 helix-turn-helix domain-containing protein [Streptomyces klenkii]